MKTSLLLSIIGILTGLVIFTVKRVVVHFIEISDFMSGFFDGFSVTLLLISLPVLIITYRNRKK